jgi:hypothetical protein
LKPPEPEIVCAKFRKMVDQVPRFAARKNNHFIPGGNPNVEFKEIFTKSTSISRWHKSDAWL